MTRKVPPTLKEIVVRVAFLDVPVSTNVGDYLLGNDGPAEVKQEENNYRFSIPVSLIDQIRPYIKIAIDHNDKFLSSN